MNKLDSVKSNHPAQVSRKLSKPHKVQLFYTSTQLMPDITVFKRVSAYFLTCFHHANQQGLFKFSIM